MKSLLNWKIVLAFAVTEFSIAFYLYYAPNALIDELNNSLPWLPDPRGHLIWAILYAAIPTIISIYATYLIADYTTEAES